MLWPFARRAPDAPQKSPAEEALDAALTQRRAVRAVYRAAQAGRADREIARLRACRDKFQEMNA